MKRILTIIVLSVAMFFITTPVFAVDPIDKDDMLLFSSFFILEMVDWGQTRTIALNPNQYGEQNTILGEHPTLEAVDHYFYTSLVVVPTVAYILPSKYRKIWLGLATMVELKYTYDNYSVGIKTTF
jgi:hypothetical protein